MAFMAQQSTTHLHKSVSGQHFEQIRAKGANMTDSARPVIISTRLMTAWMGAETKAKTGVVSAFIKLS
jgi:hypothetical protein